MTELPGRTSTPYEVPDPLVATIADTAYTLQQGDHATVLAFTGAATVTVPPGLKQPYQVGISQDGSSQVTIVAGSGVTIREPDSQLKTEKQYVVLSLMLWTADNLFRLAGRTAA